MNLRLALLMGCAWFPAAFAAETLATRIPDTGMMSWKVYDRGISVEFLQLTPEGAQATYDSRDLPPAIYNSMRGYCIFGSVVRNEASGPLTYRVVDWRQVGADGKPVSLRTKTQWLTTWRKLGADFAWSILPDDITLETGDWALGYTPVKVRPGEKFDLLYVWRQHGKKYSGIMRNLVCPGPSPEPAA